ncbi:hypothetical protein QFZ87_000708 [Bacillus sp. SLBN-46]|uniref:hypothetical protein n=1 Tax=Bacillus sp. SLBN-46 TaxID=3042283 RepID=UPI00285F488C|nr:hypothetical protein [Bacillus sp. SLBN-46]MDR6121111.1 hypothetical protein [Bacillus sp. SLBN-46]
MNKIQRELEKIQIPDEVMVRMFKGIEQAKGEEMATPIKARGMSKRKKLIGSLAGLVAVGGLFFGSTFVSPAMAQIVSKIPFLNEVFMKDLDKDVADSVLNLVRKEGLKRGYEVTGMRVGQGLMEGDDPDKVYVFLKSKDYNEQRKLEVENLTKKFLDQKGYYAKSIDVLPFKADFYASMRRINRIMMAEAQKIETLIKDKGYSVDYVGMNRGVNEIFVILPETEKHVDDVRTIIQTYQKEKYNEFSLDIRSVNLNNIDEETKLKKNLYTTFEGLLAKKEAYKINSFTYSTKGELVITIETSLEKKDQKLIEQIRKEVAAQVDKVYKQPYTINMVGLEDLKTVGE